MLITQILHKINRSFKLEAGFSENGEDLENTTNVEEKLVNDFKLKMESRLNKDCIDKMTPDQLIELINEIEAINKKLKDTNQLITIKPFDEPLNLAYTYFECGLSI
jgi:hypothetical protein